MIEALLMPADLTVRVFYPLQAGRIVLRTDQDWNLNVEATAVSADRTTFEFQLRRSQSYFYFKPCIIDQQGFHWMVSRRRRSILISFPTCAAAFRIAWPCLPPSRPGRIMSAFIIHPVTLKTP
jgi:hypothetical protein